MFFLCASFASPGERKVELTDPADLARKRGLDRIEDNLSFEIGPGEGMRVANLRDVPMQGSVAENMCAAGYTANLDEQAQTHQGCHQGPGEAGLLRPLEKR